MNESELNELKSKCASLYLQLGEKIYMQKVFEAEQSNLIKQIYECNLKANELQKADAPKLEALPEASQ